MKKKLETKVYTNPGFSKLAFEKPGPGCPCFKSRAYPWVWLPIWKPKCCYQTLTIESRQVSWVVHFLLLAGLSVIFSSGNQAFYFTENFLVFSDDWTTAYFKHWPFHMFLSVCLPQRSTLAHFLYTCITYWLKVEGQKLRKLWYVVHLQVLAPKLKKKYFKIIILFHFKVFTSWN